MGNVCNNSEYEHGIYLGIAAHENVVSGNICCNNEKYGILEHQTDTNTKNNVIIGNVCRSNGLGQILNDRPGTIKEHNKT